MPSPEAIAALKAEFNAAAEAETAAQATEAKADETTANAVTTKDVKAEEKPETKASAAERTIEMFPEGGKGEASPQKSEPPKAELASPKLAAAVRAETKVQRMREQVNREREAAVAEVRAEREAIARERAAWQRELEAARKVKEDPISYFHEAGVPADRLAQELRDINDPVAQNARQVAKQAEEIRQLKEMLAKREEREAKATQDAAVQRDKQAFVDFVNGNAEHYPTLGLAQPRAIAEEAWRAAGSGNFESFADLAEHLEQLAQKELEGARKTFTTLDERLARLAQGKNGAQTHEQTPPGNGTQAAKPTGPTKGLTQDLSARTSGRTEALTREERAAQIKAELARG